jgi:hypothetical protein
MSMCGCYLDLHVQYGRHFDYWNQALKMSMRDCYLDCHVQYCRHFDYWNQPPNMSMRVCYLDCHEAGLCYYLVIHTVNPLRPIQLFYFHLWPIFLIYLVAKHEDSASVSRCKPTLFQKQNMKLITVRYYILRHCVFRKESDVSKEYIAYFFRVKSTWRKKLAEAFGKTLKHGRTYTP